MHTSCLNENSVPRTIAHQMDLRSGDSTLICFLALASLCARSYKYSIMGILLFQYVSTVNVIMGQICPWLTSDFLSCASTNGLWPNSFCQIPSLGITRGGAD
jgi:hypothetical protein